MNVLDATVRFLATLGFAGYAPVAPGTVGTAVAAVAYWFCRDMPEPVRLALLGVSLVTGFAVAGRAERLFGGKDPGRIVIDEWVGYWVSVLFLPVTPAVIIAGFFLFRFFDIVKVFPASWVERNLTGGKAVMLDDVVAGVYANLILQIAVRGLEL